MIIKRRSKPLVLRRLEAAIPRLPQNFPRLQEMKQEISIRFKGYIGEQKVDYHLDQLPNKFTVLHDVYLKPYGSVAFQIDSLVISNNALYIIEVKNFNNTITFNTILNQFTRTDGNKEQGFRYPITQVENTQLKLMNWLHEHNIHNIPVHFFIAISDPSTIIDVIGDEESIAKIIGHSEYIPRKIIELDKKLSANGQGKWQNRKIGEAILRECTEFDYDILRRFDVKSSDIMTGVHCPECGWLGMKRRKRSWHCLKCSKTSKQAHLKAMEDYFLLFNTGISNKECRRFLRLESRSIATRILQKNNLTYIKKKRIWIRE